MLPNCNLNVSKSLYLRYHHKQSEFMRKIILITVYFIPVIAFSQGINKFQYDDMGRLHASYTGQDNGNYTFIHNNTNGGKSEVGRYKNGLKHGVWKNWDSNGKLEAIAHFKNGEKTGKWIILDKTEHTVFEISFSHNHMLFALRKKENGQIIAKR